jgi:hypothetical protein
MKIALDFDGVIHEYSKGWNGGAIYDPPVKGTKEALEALKAAGHHIMIFTTRTNTTFRKKDEPDQKLLIEEYMKKHELPYDKIWTFGKPMADIFIDDRAIKFEGNWQETVEQVRVFKVWNERSEEA